MQRIIVIIGPTASGKSALAVKLAKQFDGEIISADSRQVYRGLDIGTGKVHGAWTYSSKDTLKRIFGGVSKEQIFSYRRVTHHCIDFVSPRRVFTAAQFVAAARRAIADIARRGKIPIIAGGTAFWIDALMYNFSLPEVKPNARLRRALEKKSAAELFIILKKLDPRRAAAIEQKNPRRLIRAIEIARALGHVPKLQKHAAYDALWIGINPSYEAGSRKIRKRVHAMIRQGLIAETRKLIRQGVSKKRIREFGFEYAAAHDAIEKRIPATELAPRIIRDTTQYAKCQMRWWKRNPEIRWISPVRSNPDQSRDGIPTKSGLTSNGVSDYRKAVRLVRSFLKKI